jgi:hypothetical protein
MVPDLFGAFLLTNEITSCPEALNYTEGEINKKNSLCEVNILKYF